MRGYTLAAGCTAIIALSLAIGPDVRAIQVVDEGCPKTSDSTDQEGTVLQAFAATGSGGVVYDGGDHSLRLNKEGGIFSSRFFGATGTPQYTCSADFDKDGWNDFAAATADGKYFGFYRNLTAQNLVAYPPDWSNPAYVLPPKFQPAGQRLLLHGEPHQQRRRRGRLRRLRQGRQPGLRRRARGRRQRRAGHLRPHVPGQRQRHLQDAVRPDHQLGERLRRDQVGREHGRHRLQRRRQAGSPVRRLRRGRRLRARLPQRRHQLAQVLALDLPGAERRARRHRRPGHRVGRLHRRRPPGPGHRRQVGDEDQDLPRPGRTAACLAPRSRSTRSPARPC